VTLRGHSPDHLQHFWLQHFWARARPEWRGQAHDEASIGNARGVAHPRQRDTTGQAARDQDARDIGTRNIDTLQSYGPS